MSGLPPPVETAPARLATLALAAVGPGPHEPPDAPALGWQAWLAEPPAADEALADLAARHALTRVELVALALAVAVEVDPLAARALEGLQAPLPGPRPRAALVLRAAQRLEPADTSPPEAHLAALWGGAALRLGLLQWVGEGPLIDRPLAMPVPLALAWQGLDAGWPGLGGGAAGGAGLDPADDPPAGPGDVHDDVHNDPHDGDPDRGPPDRFAGMPPPVDPDALARLARASGARVALWLRGVPDGDGPLVARAWAAAGGARATAMPWQPPPGVGVWLQLTGRWPVFAPESAPGESPRLPALPGYDGPALVLAAADGALLAPDWRLVPLAWPADAPAARAERWQAAGLPPADARALAARWRTGAQAQHTLAAQATALALLAGRPAPQERDVARALRQAPSLPLGALAERLDEDIGDDAPVWPPALREALEQLVARCARRHGLADALGPALQARHRSGVRALFTGSSGTGKTLAAGWLATRLGLPLYRIDLSAVVSKYIGETEKNLAQLFARAEGAEVALLFDEADALFGRRTDVKDSNDRFANQQTNYLLQRIERFEGIALLTSNSRARFDPAFTRRLDAIIEFPNPAPAERRALWLAHLGDAHALDDAALNRIAALCDLAGGHIRNCVLHAAALGRPITAEALHGAIRAEHAKLGRLPPAGF